VPVKKYRKIPVTIEAIQYTGPEDTETVQEITDWTTQGFYVLDKSTHRLAGYDEAVTAEVWDYLHQTWVGVKTGDYIIKGQLGEFYPHDEKLWPNAYEEVN
jgi:hypothetical protein